MEAARSVLDLVAAGITYLAVRISGCQPDRDHPYGYGKIENLSALIVTILLLVTCAWIIYEAVQRLFFKFEQVDATFWAFFVMVVSIIVDISRSKLLMKMAIKHNNQALEADALHFSTDVWFSSVVLVGLSAVVLANLLEKYAGILAEWLHNADAVAALVVSAIVLVVSFQLGKTIDCILNVKRIRVRHSGRTYFADITVSVERNTSFEEAHLIASKAEETIQRLYPRIDIIMHVDPVKFPDETLIERILANASSCCHSYIHIQNSQINP